MEQLGPHWRDVHEIWYLVLLFKIAEKVKFGLKSDKGIALYEYINYVYDSI
jgi:hypothetical protein